MSALAQLLYMASATLFVLGVRFLGSPASARSGNRLLAIGMLLALGTTVAFAPRYDHVAWVALVALVGGTIGVVSARRVRMTAMPQMVAVFNGLGGGSAALVAAGGWSGASGSAAWLALLTMLLGAVSFGGSIIAFLKLQEWLRVDMRLSLALRVLGLAVVAAAVAGAGLMGASGHGGVGAALGVMAAAAAGGALLTLPIGGADMPVVISLLNALTGLSAAATGFVLQNQLLIIAGTLVGASGTILTQQMSRAMHRSLINVIWGGQVAQGEALSADGTVQPITPDDTAMLLRYAKKVVVVPGYGLAVARAQLEVKQVIDLLQGFGVEVLFGIHPVAGRMPGHMNVLLAEAGVPYDLIGDLDDINAEFDTTDVALIIGANDVVNPVARSDKSSPIYGMPILNADRARNVIVIKRGQGAGFSGIENALFYLDNTRMLYGDAQKAAAELIQAVKAV